MLYQQIIPLYPERWRIEPSHKALKNHASIKAFLTKTLHTQSHHVFASFCALVQFEWLKIYTKLNHFSLKRQLYAGPIRQDFQELQQMKFSVIHTHA